MKKFAMRGFKFASLLCLAAVAPTAEAANFPIGTYVYAGTIENCRKEAMVGDDDVQVQAVSTNGTILAVSAVSDPDANGVNFRLEVPVSTHTSAKSAAIGDAPRCVVVSKRGTRGAATETFPPILCASAVTNCVVVWSDAISFTNEVDGEVVKVPEDYIDGISWLMDFYGKTPYDPFADWDGDGVSNYKEYTDGTNPFDPGDFLRVTAFSVSPESAVLSFEYVGGHLYGLKSARSLSNPEWAATAFKTDEQATLQQTTVYGGDDDVGVATLYVTPVADEPRMFFKVESE